MNFLNQQGSVEEKRITDSCFKIVGRVKSVMGGRVLEHEAKTILREGWQQGRKEGEDYGVKKGRMEQA